MQELVEKETITPLIDRVRELGDGFPVAVEETGEIRARENTTGS